MSEFEMPPAGAPYPDSAPAPASPTPGMPPAPAKKKMVRRILLTLLLLGAAYLAYSLLSVYLTPDRNVRQIYLVPRDAVFIIQASEPVADWQRFSRSEPWQALRQARSFAEIARSVGSLDSLIRANKVLLSLVGKRDLLLSIHPTRPDRWDFLAVIDLQKVSKMNVLKDQIEQVFKMAGSTVTNRKYNGVNILEVRDPETREMLYAAFVDNHFIASFSPRLIEASIDERDQPQIGLDESFLELDKLVGGKGLCRLFVHYAYLPKFMSIYLGTRNEYLDLFSRSMDFAGLYFDVDSRKMECSGYTLMKEETDPYVTALLRSGKQKMKAQQIMSSRTAFYTNVGFENPARFVQELEQVLSQNEPATYEAYRSTRSRLEKYFGISMEENFLSWMAGEFALSQSEPGLLGQEPELILAIRARDIDSAKENMALLEKRIKRRSPVKVETVYYKDYQINYLEMKGFFRLFFGGLFDRFEKPYYTYVDDYVVFSNKSASLLSFVEDYLQQNRLGDQPGFRTVLSQAQGASTWFNYVDMPKFFPQLQGLLNAETWSDLQGNREVLCSFPQWFFQLVSEQRRVSMQLVMNYRPFEPESLEEAGLEEISENILSEEGDEPLSLTDGEEPMSEKELMNELQRFYVEKFQGNVLREFYPDGSLRSESEIREGVRHGRYREYYENGNLKLRGKYVRNQPRGTWKYYTEEGRFDRKEKF